MKSALYTQDSGDSGRVDDDSHSVGSYDEASSYSDSNEHGSDGESTDFSGGKSSGRGEDKLAQTETKFVLCSKFLSYLVLFLSAVTAGVVAFYYARQSEIRDFEDNVRDMAP